MATVDVTRIASNIGALSALNSLQNINTKLATHQTRLSTGKRINSAADDPAGLTIATKMLARSEGLKVTLDNLGDAKNMLSVAEGGLSKMSDIITTMRNKAEQAASDTLGSSERATIQTQLSSYAQQLQDIVDQTKWNGVKLLDQSTGPKVFQSGVDEGENTTWNLPKALTPSSLSLSEVTTVAADTSIRGASFSANAATSGMLAGMSELSTGEYAFKVLDSGYDTVAAAAAGKVNIDTTSKLLTGVTSVAAVAPAAVDDNGMVSGHYKLTVNGINAAGTAIDFSMTNLDDSTWGTNGSVYNGSMTMAAAGSATTLTDGTNNLGISLTLTGTAADMTAGQSMTFEYIKSGDVKVALTDAGGQATQIARANANTSTTDAGFYSATSAYTAAGGAYQSGRGVSATLAAIATVSAQTGNVNAFTYTQASNYSVDVSTAAKAGKYMTVANNALDTVTSALSDLGSLMSRLTFKEDTISTAQINVEASYNRIMNANMAEEQTNASKFSILQQTAIAMLAQANTAPQNLLSLFR